jgi:DNA-3-methyladenine glycosylase I
MAERAGQDAMASAEAGTLVRCAWARNDLAIRYHDVEWGAPVHDDRTLFEFLVLEGAQAGLSWDTILRKRERYREVFDNFEIEAVAGYGPEKVAALLGDAGIVRNRLKIAAAITNARAAQVARAELGSLDALLWRFVGGRPLVNRWRSLGEVPARTAESDAMSRELKRRGFTFVGSTICYALMQATGMVNDHMVDCFRYGQVGQQDAGTRPV